MIPIAYILGFLILGWVISPLFKRGGLIYEVHGQAEDLEDKKLRVYGNIKDLEFDYAMGRLSEKDFQDIRGQFTREASKVVARLEELQKHDLDTLIEADLKRVNHEPVVEVEKNEKYCIECGHKNPAKAKFCAACGEKFEEV
ncbi:MAG: hypothetical protein K9N34_03435 [Candidatus Marinimicrobia bacterium]|nr:hypothetical protein [Candidatus Neomarinimicrobiota bacterium]MCF7839596.1 hypothetical protein [Candidatus Neomarinimicrobiota bacterium]